MNTFDDLLPVIDKAGLSLVSFDEAIEERSSLSPGDVTIRDLSVSG
jgi:hypothetical protein